MDFSEKELLRKNRHIILLAYGEAGKRVVEFQANFSEVFEVLSYSTARRTRRREINRSKRLSVAQRGHEISAKHAR